MNEERGLLRAVSWRDLFPWLIIFRVYRQAARPSILLLATLGVLLTPVGWRLAEWVFLGDDLAAVERLSTYRNTGTLNRWQGEWDDVPGAEEFRDLDVARGAVARASGEMAAVFHGLVEPFRQMLDYRWSVAEFAYFLVGGLWTLAVWAFFGGTITRLAIVPLASEQQVGFLAAIRHAVRKFPTYFLAPLFPFLGVIFFGALLAAIGLLLRLGNTGVAIAGVLWLLVILGGFAMAYLLVGLLFGWPLMWPAAGAERDADLFESVSRAYSYTRQAPLKYLFYALVAALFGGLCWLLVAMFAEAVIALGLWGVSWGAGRDLTLEAIGASQLIGSDAAFHAPPMQWFGLGLIAAWTALVRIVVTAFAFSFFWCAFCAIYLLLRLNVDRREMDEVWIAEQRPAAPLASKPTIAAESSAGNEVAGQAFE
jgi:hypothetical protein